MIKKRHIAFFFLFLFILFTISAFAQNSSQCKLYNNRGKVFFDKGKYAEAEKFYKKAVTADFLNPETRYNLAILYKKKKKYKKSLDNIKKAISLKPFESEYTAFLLDLYIVLYKESIKIGQPGQAAVFLDQALKQDENFFGVHFILLKQELKEKKYADAEKRIDALISKSVSRKIKLKDKEYASLLVKKAQLAFYKKDYYATYRYIARARKDCKNIDSDDQKIIKKITGPANELAQSLINGDKAWETKDFEQAYTFYKKAISLRPDLKIISSRLTKLANIRIAQEKYGDALEFFNAGKYSEALKECNNIIGLYPESEEIQNLSERSQKKLLSLENDAKIKEKQHQERRIQDQKIKYMLEQADLLFSCNKFEAAEQEIKKILKIEPSNNYALEFGTRISEKKEAILKEKDIYNTISEFFQKRDWHNFETILKQNPNLENNFEKVLFYKAVVCKETGEYKQAKAYIDRYLKNNKKDIEAVKTRIQILFKTSNNLNILKEINKLPEKMRENNEIMRIRVSIEKELRAKKISEFFIMAFYIACGIGLLILLKVIFRGVPKWLKSRKLKKIQCFISKKNWKSALKLCRDLLARNPHDSVSRNKIKSDLARCCMEMGNSADAIRFCQEILREEKKNIKVTRILGHSFLKSRNKTDEALKEYINLYEFEPTNSNLIKIMSECFIERGSLADISRELIDKYLKLKPDDFKSLSAYADMLAEAMLSDNHAILIYERKLDIDPAAVEVRDALMTAFYKRKSYDKAVEQASILLNYDSRNLNFHKIYSDSMIALGRAEEALDFYCSTGLDSQKELAFIINKIKSEIR